MPINKPRIERVSRQVYTRPTPQQVTRMPSPAVQVQQPNQMTNTQMIQQFEQSPISSLTMDEMGNAISIGLPSNFYFYTFKDLYCKPMKNRHRAKLAAAFQQKSMRPVVEVINSLLSTSTGETDLAFKLCEQDFTFLLYWIRIHHFTKNPFKIKVRCKDPKHIADVKAGKKDKKTLVHEQIISDLNPLVTYLPNDFAIDFNDYMPSFIGVKRPQNVYVSIPRYTDVLEITEDAEHFLKVEIDEEGNPVPVGNTEYFYLANAAFWLQVPGWTLKQRCDLVGDMNDEDYERLASLSKVIPFFGAKTSVTVQCPECGATRTVQLSIDAHSFFPDL